MSKQKRYYYVMILTEQGPVLVTSVDRGTKTAHWDRDEKPLELGKFWAEDLQFGLSANFFSAFVVSTFYELESQPYRYNMGHFEWRLNDVKPESEEKK